MSRLRRVWAFRSKNDRLRPVGKTGATEVGPGNETARSGWWPIKEDVRLVVELGTVL